MIDRPAIALVLTIALVLAAVPAPAHPLPPATPHDADRSIEQLDVSAYSLPLQPGEAASFDATGIQRIWIDETAVVSARVEDGRVYLDGKSAGKAVVRFIWTNDPDREIGDDERHGIRMFRTTFIVNVSDAPQP